MSRNAREPISRVSSGVCRQLRGEGAALSGEDPGPPKANSSEQLFTGGFRSIFFGVQELALSQQTYLLSPLLTPLTLSVSRMEWRSTLYIPSTAADRKHLERVIW